ncbi:MAG TPA: stage V sporulation protein AD [Methylomusa anaerophila]|uniref:Stage V sporulation protein AD n=1 Tax=Methylomusa anaerophila TaxID=1930071 RepID=A0A348APE9_9FIRM|nr:stage V sporulation protein AD [Methylomusa anaerophila]BBB92947.1 stage V sporulation protein AD [Methylomusa anaerophila]HML87219.1 stage V sporulation protein AD [Methylomusa anaerophila]
MNKKRGKQTIVFAAPPVAISTANIVGPMEGEGLLGKFYDRILEDNLHNQSSWEKCESYMLEWAIKSAIAKKQLTPEDIDIILAGDLLNQLMSTHFAVRSLQRPFLGLYGACSTLAESMLLGAALIDGGFADNVAIGVSSHHDTAERQYRFPTEMGVQRPPLSQWTVTGAGGVVLSVAGQGPKVTAATIGKIIDMGIQDPNAMGPAMAPAAADTLWQHLQDTGRQPAYYDMIFTGDLGVFGKALVIELLKEKGLDITNNYEDCGCMIYKESQDPHAGASGCASSAVVFTGYIYQMLLAKNLKKILFIATGSLHSPTSYQQKESIPCIAHAVAIEMD